MKAAFFDVDGTLTTTRVWEGLMEYFRQRDLRRWTNRIFWYYHMPLYFLRKLGLISEGAFRSPWAAHLAWYVRGYTRPQAGQVWDWVVTQYLSERWRSDSRELLDQHRQAGDLVVLVSGGPVPLLQRIAGELDISHVVGTRFEFRDSHYTGRSLKPICIDENKASLTQSYLREHDLRVDFGVSYAYADSISDLFLLEMVAHPVATYPDDRLHAVAQERGWQIFPRAEL